MEEDRTLRDGLDALSQEGIQIVSPDLRYVYLNAAAARQGRKEPAELLGRTMRECFPGIEKTAMFSVLTRCMRERAADTLLNEFVYEDGHRAWFELRIRPCPAGLVVVSLDVTENQRVLRDLTTPVLRVHERVLLVPIVGALDDHRAAQLTEAVLTRVADTAAKVVILDVTGVPTLDTAVANDLMKVTSMLRLLGATTVLTGVAAAAAKALVQLGVDLSTMQTTNDLAKGIEVALAKVGSVLTQR